MQQIDLDLDKENELIFKIVIEGTRSADTRSRLLLESDEYSLVFPTSSEGNGQISVVIPPLEKVIKEGNYNCSLEVIVDDKIFTPIKIGTEFKKSLKIVAESVVKKRKETTVSVSPEIIVNKLQLDQGRDNPSQPAVVARQPSQSVEEFVTEHINEVEKSVSAVDNLKKVSEEQKITKEKNQHNKNPPLKENTARIKPQQRHGERPKKKRHQVKNSFGKRKSDKINEVSLRLIDHISEKHGVELTEAQFKEVLRRYVTSKNKIGKK